MDPDTDPTECERCGEDTLLGSETCFDCGQEVLLAATGPFYYDTVTGESEKGNLLMAMVIVSTRFYDQNTCLSDEHLTEISPELNRALERIYSEHGLSINECAEGSFEMPAVPEEQVDAILAEQEGMFTRRKLIID